MFELPAKKIAEYENFFCKIFAAFVLIGCINHIPYWFSPFYLNKPRELKQICILERSVTYY